MLKMVAWMMMMIDIIIAFIMRLGAGGAEVAVVRYVPVLVVLGSVSVMRL